MNGSLSDRAEEGPTGPTGPLVAPATRLPTPDGGRPMTRAEMHLQLIDLLAPPSIVVDAEHEMLHISPAATAFLYFGGGEPSRNVLRAVVPALKAGLQTALHHAHEQRAPVEVAPVRVRLAGGACDVAIGVRPVQAFGGGFLVLLRREAVGANGPAAGGAFAELPRVPPEPVDRHLAREVDRLEAQLRQAQAQHEISTEELTAGNEELQAMNEELQAAAEELDTSREALQSTNAELVTVNQALKDKVDDLGHAHSDILNLMDATAIATVFLDRELRVKRFTPSAAAIFKLRAGDVGRPLSDLASGLDYPQLADDARAVLRSLQPCEREVGGVGEVAEVGGAGDGLGRWYLARARPYRTTGDLIAGVVLTLVDITERKAAQQALETADAAKDRFLAVLSHELRNPLASLSVAAELLAPESLATQDQVRAARVIRRQAAFMKAMLDDLLDMASLRQGRLALKPGRITAQAVVEAALETARPLIEHGCHVLELQVAHEEIPLDADPVRLGQVLSNLLSNAAKYTPARGRIVLSVRTEGRDAVFEVADDGIGMEPDTIETLFEMFVQGDRADAHARAGGGLGIGLALVRNIVELHGGTVQGESEGLGRGSRFTVRLPAARASAHAPQAASPHAATDDREDRDGPARLQRLLLADDNIDALWGMGQVLGAAGFQVETAHNGIDALRVAREQHPDAAVLDIGMPGLDGHEVARCIRAEPWGRDMVLIAATGWGQPADRAAALAAGFDAHVVKPVTAGELQRLLRAQEAARQARRLPAM